MLQVISYIDESDCTTKREKQLYEIALDNQELSECYRRERNKNHEELVARDSVLQTRKNHILMLCAILDDFKDSMDDADYRNFKAIRKDYIDTNIE
tara:strand:- start:3958 stop:4245 length:288 start_codon:yes stop_codon:yes gene_type:complete